MAMTPTSLPEASGVYRILNTVTGECYVGASANIQKRAYAHVYQLQYGKHYAKAMQASYCEHGPDAFTFEVLALCEVPELVMREEGWVASLKPAFNTHTKCTAFRPGFGLDPGGRASRARRPSSRSVPRNRVVKVVVTGETTTRPVPAPRPQINRLSHEARRERRRKMADALEAGTSVDDVAMQFGVTQATVNVAAREHNVSFPRIRRKQRDEQIVELSAKGMIGEEIATRVGCTEPTVSQVLRRNGIKRKRGLKPGTPTPWCTFVPREVWDTVDWTKTDRAIADELVVSGARVRQVRQRLGKNRRHLLGLAPRVKSGAAAVAGEG